MQKPEGLECYLFREACCAVVMQCSANPPAPEAGEKARLRAQLCRAAPVASSFNPIPLCSGMGLEEETSQLATLVASLVEVSETQRHLISPCTDVGRTRERDLEKYFDR